MSNINDKKLVSLVLPIYNEAPCIPQLWERLAQLQTTLNSVDLEFVFVNDGSQDESWSLLKELATQNPNIKLVGFSRNFGHQIAVTAGLDYAKGDAAVVMDADLQDPPELLIQMVAKWEEGFDVVYAQRRARKGESIFKKITANLFYRIINRMSKTPIPRNTGDFRLMSRRVVEALKKMPEKDRFVRGMVSWVGFKQTPLLFDRDPRIAGETKYPFRRMIAFAADAIFSFSNKPLRWATWLGFFTSFLALSYIIIVIILKIIGFTFPGYASIMVAILFLGGVQLITIGILGEYIGRIYNEDKNRPLYVIDSLLNIDEPL